MLRCPICNIQSKIRNTQKIGNIKRTVSVCVLGLASSKIGKNYKCNNYGYKW